jgi:hypothetical protein
VRLVFCNEGGGYLDRNRVKHPFWTCTRAEGVPEIRIHDLRHPFASQLVVKGSLPTAISTVEKLREVQKTNP